MKKKLEMKEDLLVRAVKKAWRESKTGELGRLLVLRTRWARKATIATNKLAKVDEMIRELCAKLAATIDKGGTDANKD